MAEDDPNSVPWPDVWVLHPDALVDRDDEEFEPVVDDDAEHPQLVQIFDSRDDAEALAEALAAQHGGLPFLTRLEPGDDPYLVTADVLPTEAGRYAVLLVIETDAV